MPSTPSRRGPGRQFAECGLVGLDLGCLVFHFDVISSFSDHCGCLVVVRTATVHFSRVVAACLSKCPTIHDHATSAHGPVARRRDNFGAARFQDPDLPASFSITSRGGSSCVVLLIGCTSARLLHQRARDNATTVGLARAWWSLQRVTTSSWWDVAACMLEAVKA